jgi:hypothetical protein
MNDERRSILDMLSKEKITVEEADQLLHAIDAIGSDPSSAIATSTNGEPRRARWLRVAVERNTDAGRKREVNVRIPALLVRAGVRLGSLIPRADARFVAGAYGNLDKLDRKQLDELLNSMGEMTVDVENGKAQVRIWCE